jgi:hypothetical protein
VVALEVAGADADGFDADEDFTGSGYGYGDLLESVVLGSVHDDGLHGGHVSQVL